MKINKILIALLTGTLLCGCGSKDPKNENMYEINEGGTVVDLTNLEQSNTLATKAKGVMDSATGADNVGLHLVVENAKFNYEKTSDTDYTVGEFEVHSDELTKIDFEGKGKLDIVANGLQSATKFSELGAYVGLKEADINFSLKTDEVETGYYPDENHLNYEFTTTNLNVEAWLKDSKLYADLSNEAFIEVGNQLFTTVEEDESESEIIITFEDMLSEFIGTFKPIFTFDLEGDPFTYPLIGDDIKSITNSIDVTTIAQMIAAYGDFAKEVLTVKIYDDGSVGLYLDVTKDKVSNIYKKLLILGLGEDAALYSSEQLDSMVSDELDFLKTCNVKIAIVINADGSLKRIGIDADVLANIISHDMVGNAFKDDTTQDISLKLKSYIKMDYNEAIAYPDFSSFEPSKLPLGF